MLRVGAAVVCQAGTVGRLKFIVIDRQRREVSDLVVDCELAECREVIIPAGWVASSDHDRVTVNASLSEIAELPCRDRIGLLTPDPSFQPVGAYPIEAVKLWPEPYGISGGQLRLAQFVRLGLDSDEVLIRRGLPVRTVDGGAIGTVDHLALDDKHQVRAVLVQRRGRFAKQLVKVPFQLVSWVGERGVRLSISESRLCRLPAYRPLLTDRQIELILQRTLATDPRTRDCPAVISVADGVVHTSDPSGEIADLVSALAYRTHGVIGVDYRPATTQQGQRMGPLQLQRQDIEATLRDLLTHFHDSPSQSSDTIERFAREGAEALLTQSESPEWLDAPQSADFLGMSELELLGEIEQGKLPSIRDADGVLHLHRRDLSLFRMGRRLGATEEKVWRRTKPVTWSAEAHELGLDPWRELTPG